MKLNEIQENTERQSNKIRKTIQEQNENFNKNIEIIKRKQTEILELKNTVSEIENAMERINSRIKQNNESVLQDRNFEIM